MILSEELEGFWPWGEILGAVRKYQCPYTHLLYGHKNRSHKQEVFSQSVTAPKGILFISLAFCPSVLGNSFLLLLEQPVTTGYAFRPLKGPMHAKVLFTPPILFVIVYLSYLLPLLSAWPIRFLGMCFLRRCSTDLLILFMTQSPLGFISCCYLEKSAEKSGAEKSGA